MLLLKLVTAPHSPLTTTRNSNISNYVFNTAYHDRAGVFFHIINNHLKWVQINEQHSIHRSTRSILFHSYISAEEPPIQEPFKSVLSGCGVAMMMIRRWSTWGHCWRCDRETSEVKWSSKRYYYVMLEVRVRLTCRDRLWWWSIVILWRGRCLT